MTLLKLVLHTQADNQPPSNGSINIFGYRSNIPVADELNELADAFEAQVLPAIMDTLSISCGAGRIEVYELDFGVEYIDRILTPGVGGTRPGQFMPNFVAWAYKLQRATVGKRSGAKRFGIISETDVEDGVAAAGVGAQLDALATALASPLRIGLVDTWFPEILEQKPPGVFPWTSHPISGVIFRGVTTQNSRKR